MAKAVEQSSYVSSRVDVAYLAGRHLDALMSATGLDDLPIADRQLRLKNLEDMGDWHQLPSRIRKQLNQASLSQPNTQSGIEDTREDQLPGKLIPKCQE
jgi:hypothetical protein